MVGFEVSGPFDIIGRDSAMKRTLSLPDAVKRANPLHYTLVSLTQRGCAHWSILSTMYLLPMFLERSRSNWRMKLLTPTAITAWLPKLVAEMLLSLVAQSIYHQFRVHRCMPSQPFNHGGSILPTTRRFIPSKSKTKFGRSLRSTPHGHIPGWVAMPKRYMLI